MSLPEYPLIWSDTLHQRDTFWDVHLFEGTSTVAPHGTRHVAWFLLTDTAIRIVHGTIEEATTAMTDWAYALRTAMYQSWTIPQLRSQFFAVYDEQTPPRRKRDLIAMLLEEADYS